MRLLRNGVYFLLFGGGMMVPVALVAQSQPASSSTPVSTLNEQQRTGNRLFLQNCGLCHVPTPKNAKDPKDQGTTIGPRLDGLFKGANPRPEAVVRTFIQQGVQGKMPGFQHGLEPKEIDAIIVYLKSL